MRRASESATLAVAILQRSIMMRSGNIPFFRKRRRHPYALDPNPPRVQRQASTPRCAAVHHITKQRMAAERQPGSYLMPLARSDDSNLKQRVPVRTVADRSPGATPPVLRSARSANGYLPRTAVSRCEIEAKHTRPDRTGRESKVYLGCVGQGLAERDGQSLQCRLRSCADDAP